MPMNLLDVLTFSSPIVAPVGGDVRTAASVRAGLQGLANRTAYIKDLLDSGITKLRYVTSLAALKAITGQSTGDVVIILNETDDDSVFDAMGVFYYASGLSNAAQSLSGIPFIVAPDVGSGRWVNILASNMIGFGGASTDLRWAIPPQNATVGISEWTSSSPGQDDAWETLGPGGAETDVSGVSLSRSVLSGDKILIDGQFNLKVTLDGVSDVAYVHLYGGITTPSTKLATARVGTRDDAAAVSVPISFSRVVTAGSAGTYALKLTVDSVGAGTSIVFMSQGSLRMHVIRP